MKLRYEKRGSGFKRVCPFSIFGNRIVGAASCQKCPWFVSIDKKNRIVDCSKKP